jgi:hypothetical protein
MSLVYLLNAPRNADEWAIWSYAHRDQHLLIIQAVQAQFGISLTEYQVDPIPFQDLTRFLDNNQQMHDDFNEVLGTQSSDLQLADFRNPSELQAWIYLHRREHETAAEALKI